MTPSKLIYAYGAVTAFCTAPESAVNSPIEEGHKSVALLHLGNIAWRVGRELRCDPSNGHILGDDKAEKLAKRDYEKGWEPKV